MEFKSKYEAYEYCKNMLTDRGKKVEEYREINYGIQFNAEIEQKKYIIRIYESKKNGVKIDLSMIRNPDIENQISNIIYKFEENESGNEGIVNLPQSFIVNSKEALDSIKNYFSEIGAVGEDSNLEYKDYVYTINNIKVTIFKSGKVLMQGKSTEFSDKIYNDLVVILKKEVDEEFKKDIFNYFKDSEDYSNFFEETRTEKVLNKGEMFLGKSLFQYLNINDQMTILDAIKLYEYTRDNNIEFNNYAIIVRNFAIAFEGFLVKIFLECNIITEEEYDSDVRTALGTKLAKRRILEFFKNPERNKDLAVYLEYVWQQHRNKNLHSDFKVPKQINSFKDAEHDVDDVRRAMQKCFETLDFEKIELNRYSKVKNSKSVLIENVDIDNALTCLVSKGFNIKTQKKALWMAQNDKIAVVNINNNSLKLIGPEQSIGEYEKLFSSIKLKVNTNLADIEENAIIGTDESGKGDYFGPLVVAGVYADEKTKKQLRKLGVDDSKKIKDSQIALLAIKIKEICKYQVVVIRNERYNELYYKINNLNKLLAWGHARVIENILENTECNIALSDQFGNPELIENALMKRGKEIVLEQRPKAEENVVVAAASILARDEFVKSLNIMSKQFGLKLPKGASNNTKEVAKTFVSKYGKENLNKVAKLHFKTTKEL